MKGNSGSWDPRITYCQKVSDGVIKGLESASKAASGTPAALAAIAAENAGKAAALASMGSTISRLGAMAIIHMCSTPLPIPPHGPGVELSKNLRSPKTVSS